MTQDIVPSSETLFSKSIPRLNTAFNKYKVLAIPQCTPVLMQHLGEVARRLSNAVYLLKSVHSLEERAPDIAMQNLFHAMAHSPTSDTIYANADLEFDILRLHTESFYWVAHRTLNVLNASQKSFQRARLPGLVGEIKCRGVTNVRNQFIEHPFVANETFSLGGMWKGPVIGEIGRDPHGKELQDLGLYVNATEWANAVSIALEAAANQLQ